MITHCLKLAWRQLLKYHLQSLVSILGLGIGFACFSLTMLWIRYERTYDTQHPEVDRLYVVYEKKRLNVREPLGAYLAANLPEAEMATGVRACKSELLIDGVKRKVRDVCCDSTFLKMMGIRVVAGNADFWMHKNQYAVTEEFAAKTWGTENPIGKKLFTPHNLTEWTVTAVVSSYGEHTNFPYDFLYGSQYSIDWFSSRGVALVRIRQNVDGKAFMEKMDTLVVKVGEVYRHGNTYSGFDYSGLRAVPVSEYRQVLSDSGVNYALSAATGLVQFRHIRLVGLAGALLILSALLNYLTLFLNRIFIRQREMVLRMALGGSAWSILAMLFTEYVMLLFIALWVGRFIMDSLMPWFLELTGVSLFTGAIHGETILYSLGVTLIGFLFSALAIHYFRRKSLQHTLQGRGAHHTYQNFRKVSVVVQLVISIGFTFCTVVMMLQLEKLRHTDPGFRRERMAVLSIYDDNDRHAFAQHLNEMPEVEEWHAGYSLFPKTAMIGFGMSVEGEDKFISACMVIGAKDYQEFYGLRLKEGRWLEEGDKDCAVVTEATVREMGVENPIGRRLIAHGANDYTIVGVAEDIYYRGPVDKSEPHLFCTDMGGSSYGDNPYLIKYHPGTWQSLRKKITALMESSENSRFAYYLYNCEEEFDKVILSEITLRKLMAAVSVVCILISLFGIWSMIMLNCEQRRKEIAVRKVFGATVGNILRQFALEYGLLLVVASVIAFPVGYVCMNPWVEQYVYQISFSWWIFASIFAAVFLLVALCVGWRVWRTAIAPPAEEIVKG